MSVTYSFDEKVAAEYDSSIRRSIPGYDLLHQLAAQALGARLAATARVLCVGSGTGFELALLSARFSGWQLVGVDTSEQMNVIARQRVQAAGVARRVDVVDGAVANLSAELKFDAAVAVLVMHFLPDDGSKEAFLQEISARLKPGASYFHVDICGVRGSKEFDALIQEWRRFQLSNGTPSAEVDEFFKSRFPKVCPISRERTEELLIGAGFRVGIRPLKALVFESWLCEKR